MVGPNGYDVFESVTAVRKVDGTDEINIGSAILAISSDLPNSVSAFSAVAATVNNVGPGLGMADLPFSYSEFSDRLLTFTMIAGSLEIYLILIL